MAGIGDLSPDDKEDIVESGNDGNSSSSSKTGSSSEDEYPRYIEETPFIAVVEEDGELEVYNRPQDYPIVKRQYQKGSELKVWEPETSDKLVKYWMTDWMFKRDRNEYEREYNTMFLTDLREEPRKTLNKLETALWEAKGQEIKERTRTCAVCGEELAYNPAKDQKRSIMGKYVCLDHTVEELYNSRVTGNHRARDRKWE